METRNYGKKKNQTTFERAKTYEDVKTAKDATFDWRAEATVIFVNNFAFNEDLNLQVNLYQMII